MSKVRHIYKNHSLSHSTFLFKWYYFLCLSALACSRVRLWKLDTREEWRNTSGGLWDERTEKDSACFVDSKENKWVGSQQSWSKEGTVRHCQSKEASILWSHHDETRELPGERNNARNNARCTQARKTTHGLDRQHQVVDRTLCGRVNQNDRG